MVLISGLSQMARAQYSFKDTPLMEVIEKVHLETSYLFLYRESLVRGITIQLEAEDQEIMEALKAAIRPKGLDLLVIEAQKQVVIFRSQKERTLEELYLQGYMVNANTGERLPFATLSWKGKEGLKGTVANESGYFQTRITLDDPGGLTLRSSYIGFKPHVISFSAEELRQLDELTIRLSPTITNSREVVVLGLRRYTDQSSIQKTVDIARGTVLGEHNIIKSMQQLPAVTTGPALSEGLHVRGSPADGFQVLLDGMTMYNQTHLFGLFDNFNADALQIGGLYVGITPADYEAPMGGTLALITRTGSVLKYKAKARVSNTSANLTLEGPLSKGKSSLMISGRTSLLEQVNWFGNEDLLRWGLDVDRPYKLLAAEGVNLRSDLIRAGNTSASFGDIHAKFNLETRRGSRLILSGYYGYDDIQVHSERLFRRFSSLQGEQLIYEPVTSENRWKNGKLSGHFQQRLNDHLHHKVMAGWSVFNNHFYKDDFTYTQINPGTNNLESFTTHLGIKSVLNEIMVRDDMEWILGTTRISTGISYKLYSGEYFEDSFERPSYFKEDQAHKVDAYLHSDIDPVSYVHISGGLRVHYYSRGDYWSFSPRIKLYILPQSDLSLGGGYSRNFQHVNRISFSNVQSSDVWIMVDENQPPSFVDQFTAGVYLEKPHFLAHVEAYIKDYEHLRLHEIETYSVTNAFGAAPWFSNNSGYGKGAELQLINRYDRFELNQSLTLSQMQLQNPEINNGKVFLADWNRKWQYTGTISLKWMEYLQTNVTQVFATGTPNKLNVFGLQDQQSLDHYYRTDVRLSYHRKLGKALLEASLNFYNILNVQNPWYREYGFGVDESSGSPRFESLPIEVYDLGIQPSFSVSVRF